MHGGRRDEREEAERGSSQRFKKVESTWRRLQKPGFGVFEVVSNFFIHFTWESSSKGIGIYLWVSEYILYTSHVRVFFYKHAARTVIRDQFQTSHMSQFNFGLHSPFHFF
jgi:hypothetical protein